MSLFLLYALPAALMLPVAAAAQTTPTADTTRTYRHHLGLTASPVLDGFFRNNRSLPLGLLYKRQVAPHRAWRYGIVLSEQYTEQSTPLPKRTDTFVTQSWGVALSIGQEWQRQLGKRWVGYAGVEVGASYSGDRADSDEVTVVFTNGGNMMLAEKRVSRFIRYSGMLRPLAGLRYQVRPYLYVSAEMAFTVLYAHINSSLQSQLTRTDTGEQLAETNLRYEENQFQMFLQPIKQVSLHYQFGR